MGFKNPEQFYAVNKVTVEAALRLANSALARAERLAALNLNTASALLQGGAGGSQALATVNSPEATITKDAAPPRASSAPADSSKNITFTMRR